jgi:hypothetical protein
VFKAVVTCNINPLVFKFVVDGEWTLGSYPTVTDEQGNTNHVVELPLKIVSNPSEATLQSDINESIIKEEINEIQNEIPIKNKKRRFGLKMKSSESTEIQKKWWKRLFSN